MPQAVLAQGAFGMTAVTAITAQNSHGVQGVHVVPPAALEQQLDSVLGDLGADVVKTGMLADAATVEVRGASWWRVLLLHSLQLLLLLPLVSTSIVYNQVLVTG
jgi:hydroxymethylpyrimidine/phosphomethylpyrimidine kinase